jgi:pilus assembly protein CpaC
MGIHRVNRLAAVSAGLLAAALLAPPGMSLPAAAAELAKMPTVFTQAVARRLQLGVGKSVIVDLPEEASEIFIGQPTVANAVVRSARRLYIDAIANGQTTIFALDKNGRQIAVIEVSVGRDVAELTELLAAAIPGNDIQVKTVADSVILMGSVASAGEAQKALDIASGFIGTSVLGGATNSASPASPGAGGAGQAAAASLTVTSSGTPLSGKVINSLVIRGLDQVSLRVTVTEIRREILKQLGISMSGTGQAPNSLTLSNPFALNGVIAPESATLGWANASGTGFSATLQAFERQGVARTLAEPTVTAISGESAKFLAGGSIPVPSGETCSGPGNTGCLLSFAYQPYGVTLNFTPVVLSQGRIQLRIATEVTDIDNTKQITILGTSVPAFRTRRNETTVELPSGGSIASAGLISTETQQEINGVPGLMNLPILGALFRSRDYQRDETELLIIVTPYIVHAVDPKDVVRPDANYVDATDPQTWLLGRVNRLYSSSGNSQRIENYTGKVGFIND